MSMDLAARWPALRAAWRRAQRLAGDGPLDAAERARAARAIARLSARLTRERASIGERYLDDPELLGAYLLFYWPISYAQARSVLGELGRPPGRVLDVGAGPLPMTWAAIDAGAAHVTALERVERARALGLALGDGPIDARAWDAARDPLPDGRFDTIVVGHLLNELPAAARLLAALRARLAEGGRLVIIEPALRETSRALLELRDRALADGAVAIAPCLVQARCPALAKATDWCHAERAWTPPAELAALADDARIHKDRLKLSYLVLASGEAPAHDPSLFRIVSEPLDQKGKHVRIGCGPVGRAPLVLRARDAGGPRAAFTALERGDVVRVTRLSPRGDGLRLDEDSEVELLAPAGAPVRAPR